MKYRLKQGLYVVEWGTQNSLWFEKGREFKLLSLVKNDSGQMGWVVIAQPALPGTHRHACFVSSGRLDKYFDAI